MAIEPALILVGTRQQRPAGRELLRLALDGIQRLAEPVELDVRLLLTIEHALNSKLQNDEPGVVAAALRGAARALGHGAGDAGIAPPPWLKTSTI